MKQSTKIDFQHRRIVQISDFSELVEVLVPGNRNQQHAAAAMFFELKWANGIVPNLAYLEKKHRISRRILQRTRAKLARLGVIKHVSHLNARHGGRSGWKLSGRFERSLTRLAGLCTRFKDTQSGTREKDALLVVFADARRTANRCRHHRGLPYTKSEDD
jgi:hypothetical protein